MADSNEGAEIWAEYVGIDLDRTEAGVLSGSRVSTPDGPFGPKIKVTVTVRKGD
ncbi:hypothetical protein [Streptomyces cyaneofuscatus]|uniref:hypothetical protein n=1 Tax=Streptomyces cyaneofuscatus TaxID=66883 RepID=UPI0036E75C4A